MAKTTGIRLRLLALAAAIAALPAVLPSPAQAQFFGDNFGYQPYRRWAPPPSDGFFPHPFFQRPFVRRASPPPVDSSRAPAPHKAETPPTSTVVVIGDSLADWLAYGLEEIHVESPQIGIVRKVRPNTGVIHYDPRNETLDWSQALKDLLGAEKPSAIVVMLGLNDRVALRERAPQRDTKPLPAPPSAQPVPATQTTPQAQAAPPSAPASPDAAPPGSDQPAASADPPRPTPPGTYEFHTDQWAQLYTKRVDDMIAALKSRGVPVLWVGLPAIRGPKATGDMSYLDDIYHAEADKAGIVYVDVWDGFVDDNGRYAVQGPDFEGQIRRLRSGDGVHFTKFGALKLAHLVDQQLSRIIAAPATPVALPAAPEASAPVKSGAARPAVGPVLPLKATGGPEGGDLLGAGGQPASRPADESSAAAVLVRGDALPAPAGRADDFTWPRPAANTAPAQTAPAPPAAPPPAAKK